ncbi:hypothetical protein O6H91_01G168800 [Diphasiastrum complanatum]|uniref:Uncharacterized protein n=1 Tax=Diphasiastrum complanatum TaxID=34168 RepID=A0ACC2EYT5_DIPCM|nr:hypothetical protein O6H91_01G168800 [Diphasiastrum complanatum]
MEEQQQQQQQAGQLTIVGPQFCSPYPTEYVIQKKVLSLSGGDFNVTDTNGNLFFKVDGRVWSMREKRVLLDALDTPVLCMKRKYLSLHSTWWAFLGNSISSGKELFTIKQSAVFQLKTSLDVFLAHNTGVPDFNIKGDFIARSCLIYHYNQVIAEASNFNIGGGIKSPIRFIKQYYASFASGNPRAYSCCLRHISFLANPCLKNTSFFALVRDFWPYQVHFHHVGNLDSLKCTTKIQFNLQMACKCTTSCQ